MAPDLNALKLGAGGLLCLEEKSGTALGWKEPVTKFIQNNFSDREAEDAAEDLQLVDDLRKAVVEKTAPLEARKDSLTKYFRALASIESRFPVSKEGDHVALEFTWFDAFQTRKKATQSNIHFEKAAVLFNFAAVQSQEALATDRTQPEGVKVACHAFQMAAGACAHLRDSVSLKVSSNCTVDLGKECCNMLVWLMLAQAQECVYQKALADQKSASVLAKLAKQVSAYYEEVSKALGAAPLNGHVDKTWAPNVAVKVATFSADAFFRSALAYKAEQKIGCEIARLKQAMARILEAKRVCRTPCAATEGLHALEALVLVEQSVADKENQCVYMEQVPAPETLPAITPHSLVKPLAPTDILEPHGEALFAKIVPDSSTKALSKYTELVDNIIREQAAALARSHEDAAGRLAQLHMPDLLKAAEGQAGALAVPSGLRTFLEELSERGGAETILEAMTKQLQQLRAATADMLVAAVQALDEEGGDDEGLRQQYGVQWNRPASASLSAPLRERLEAFKNNLTQAHTSDKALEIRVQEATPEFHHLHPDRIGDLLPRLEPPMVSVVDDAEAPKLVASLRQLLDRVDQLGSERLQLEEELRVVKDKDDILPKVMSAPESFDALFQAELKKYAPIQDKIQKNAEEQNQALSHLAQTQANFLQVYQVDEWMRACESAMGGVRRVLDQYHQLCDNLQEGVVFYTNLQDAIGAVAKQCEDFVYSRNLQLKDMREQLQENAQQRAAQEDAAHERALDERAARERAHFAQMSINRPGGAGYPAMGQPPPQGFPGHNQHPHPGMQVPPHHQYPPSDFGAPHAFAHQQGALQSHQPYPPQQHPHAGNLHHAPPQHHAQMHPQQYQRQPSAQYAYQPPPSQQAPPYNQMPPVQPGMNMHAQRPPHPPQGYPAPHQFGHQPHPGHQQ